MREIKADTISAAVKDLFLKANVRLGEDVIAALIKAHDRETHPRARQALAMILENACIAASSNLPICQDTGLAVIFAEIGQEIHINDGGFRDAVEEGVRQAYREGFFRTSVCDPLSRVNTKDNTPAVIHTEIIPGDRIRLFVMPKGGGSENMSSVAMLLPAEGREGICRHVTEQVRKAGPNPCPPVIVGVGIGGAMEEAVIMAKKALLRPVGTPNESDERLSALERDLLRDINTLGIGPQGLGGETTCLAVHVLAKPCHIASLPVAVSMQCHAARHAEGVI